MNLPMLKPMNGLSAMANKEDYKKRPHLTFDLRIPAHKEAWELFCKHGNTTAYIVECILRAENCITKSEVEELLKNVNIISSKTEVAEENNMPPDEFFDFDSW